MSARTTKTIDPPGFKLSLACDMQKKWRRLFSFCVEKHTRTHAGLNCAQCSRGWERRGARSDHHFRYTAQYKRVRLLFPLGSFHKSADIFLAVLCCARDCWVKERKEGGKKAEKQSYWTKRIRKWPTTTKFLPFFFLFYTSASYWNDVSRVACCVYPSARLLLTLYCTHTHTRAEEEEGRSFFFTFKYWTRNLRV